MSTREILDERARLLGEAFTLDPRGLQLLIDMMREQHGGPGSLRIQRADRNILHNAARQVALNP